MVPSKLLSSQAVPIVPKSMIQNTEDWRAFVSDFCFELILTEDDLPVAGEEARSPPKHKTFT